MRQRSINQPNQDSDALALLCDTATRAKFLHACLYAVSLRGQYADRQKRCFVIEARHNNICAARYEQIGLSQLRNAGVEVRVQYRLAIILP